MISEHGRKFFLTNLGMIMVFFLALLNRGDADAITAIGGMVLAFNGANTVVSWAYSRANHTQDSTTTLRQEERDTHAGFQPTP